MFLSISDISLGDVIKWAVIIIVALGVLEFAVSVIQGLLDTDKRRAKREAKRAEEIRKEQEAFNREQKAVGDAYEDEAARTLSKVLGEPLRNVITPHPNGNDTETDIIFVDTKGVWLIECKEHGKTDKDANERDNYVMNGRSNGQTWIVCKPGKPNYAVDNPFMQNDHHLEAIDDILTRAGAEPRLRSLVATNCHFSLFDFGITVTDLSTNGFYDMRNGKGIIRIAGGSKGKKTFAKWHETQSDVYSPSQVTQIKMILKQFEADPVTRAAHDSIAAYHNEMYEGRRQP